MNTTLNNPLRARSIPEEFILLGSHVDSALHKLASLVDATLPDLFYQLQIDHRFDQAESVAYAGYLFIESLREAAIGKGGAR
jgi:hypothetical protein